MSYNAMIYGLVAKVINEAEKYNDEENKCACCLEPTLTKSYCGHFICIECYDEWRKNKSTCPSCRGEYGDIQVPYKNNFTNYAKNFMRLIICELCENIKCKCSVIEKTFYNAIPFDAIGFFKSHIKIFDEELIRLYIKEAEEKIKITFWGENKFTIYKKGEDWKNGITINYKATKDDVMGNFDSEFLNDIANNCDSDEIEEFLDSLNLNMNRAIIRLLRRENEYYLSEFLRSEIFGENAWVKYIYNNRLYKEVLNYPYIEIGEEEDDYENEGCYRVFAHIYNAEDDIRNGVICAEYGGECDESEESEEESEEDKEKIAGLTSRVFDNVSPLNQIPLSNEERLTISNDFLNSTIEYENL